MARAQHIEPILVDDASQAQVERFVIDKSKYQDIWKFYKECERSVWHAHDIVLDHDRLEFSKLNANEQRVIKIILAFFAAADGIVNENLMTNFAQEINIPQARCFYAFQMYTEAVHQETYTDLLEIYVPRGKENDELLRAIETLPVITKKAEWALKWIGTPSSGSSFGQRLFAFACVEGIHFASSFAIIYWFKESNRLPGLTQANEYIARDETTHWQFAALLFKYVQSKPSQAAIEAIVDEAVDLEMEFVDYVFQQPLVGMNKELMREYVESVADMIMSAFGYHELYGASNPFANLKMIQLKSYSNFFERPPTDYQKATAASAHVFQHLDAIDF